jgi:hypothetical protein
VKENKLMDCMCLILNLLLEYQSIPELSLLNFGTRLRHPSKEILHNLNLSLVHDLNNYDP